jgi:hypothetical protein
MARAGSMARVGFTDSASAKLEASSMTKQSDLSTTRQGGSSR